MPTPLKDFSDLKFLQQKLKVAEDLRLTQKAERQYLAAQAERDAQVFRDSVGNIQPLTSTFRKK